MAVRTTLSLAIAALVGLGAGWFLFRTPAPGGAEHGHEEKAADEPKEPDKPRTVELDKDAVERLGIAVATARAATAAPIVRAPGRLIADPAAAGSVRAPLAGRLAPGPRAWPTLGQTVTAGDTLAVLQPRLSVAERSDLAQRRAQATGERAAAEAAITAAQREFERVRALHAEGNAASERAVEAAAAELAGQRAHFAAAEAALSALPAGDPAAVFLTASRSGVVTAIGARPGEDVDAGAELLQVAEPARVLARIDVPAAAELAPTIAAVRLELPGANAPAIAATFTAWVDAVGGDRAALFAVDGGGETLRAGLPVVAHLPARGEPTSGLRLPETAIVRRGDGAWVWIRSELEHDTSTFVRVPVQLTAPDADGWLATSSDAAWRPDAPFVTVGAGVLWSIERMRAADAEAGG